jgi:transglutaminase-like putative cysteine protease
MTQDRRMTLTVAFAVVCASTAMFPVFNGTPVWFDAGIGAAVTVAAAGTLSRLRTLPAVVCLLISLTALLLFLNLTFESSLSFWRIVPTRASVTALGDLLTSGFSDAGKYVPPAPTSVTSLVFLGAAGVGITAVVTDLIAVRLRSTAMAGLPLLVLFTVPATINVQRSGVSTCVIFALATGGYLAMLSADGRERIRVWGRLVSLWRPDGSLTRPSGGRSGPGYSAGSGQGAAPGGADPEDPGASGGRHRQRSALSALRGPDTRSLAAAGRRVGFASIVFALLAPLLVPGLHAARIASSDWVFGTGTGSGGTPIPNLLTEISQQLQETHPKVVMTYVTNNPDPGYLQQEVLYNLSSADGWEDPFTQVPPVTTYPFTTALPLQAPGVTDTAFQQFTTTITVAKGASSQAEGFNVLPAPFPPVNIYNLPGIWQVDPNTLMVVTQKASLADVTYQVVNRNVDPSPALLEKAARPQGMSPYLQLPASYSQSQALLQIARKITKGATTELDKANDLANYLSSAGGFTYDTFAPGIDSVADLLTFLQKDKTGDCVQAAYAMTVMLRVLGIPSRFVLGYTQGTKETPGHYEVKNTDAHAWPEAFFAGYGWIRFEPVPFGGPGTAIQPPWSQRASSTSGGSPAPPTTPASAGKTGGNLKNSHIRQLGGDGPGGPGLPSTAAAKPATGTPWTALALAIIAALALACGIIAIVAPLGQLALSGRPGERRRRRRLNGGLLLVILAGGGIIAIALERLLTHTRGLNVTSGWATVGIAFGAACVVALAVPTTCRLVMRRWRWMRADDDAARAHIAWVELRADLADYGLAPLDSESPRALAGRVRTGLALAEPAAEAVGRIALAEERATYSARPTESKTLREDSMAARHGIAAAAGRGARWRAWLFPASTMGTLADAAGRIPQAWAAWRSRLPLGRR